MVKGAMGSDAVVRMPLPRPPVPTMAAIYRAAHLHRVGDDVALMMMLVMHRLHRGRVTIYGYSAGTYTAAALRRACAILRILTKLLDAKASTEATANQVRSTTIQTEIAALNFPPLYLRHLVEDSRVYMVHAEKDMLSRVDVTSLLRSLLRARLLIITEDLPKDKHQKLLGYLSHGYSWILRDLPGLPQWAAAEGQHRRKRTLWLTAMEIGATQDIGYGDDVASYALAQTHWMLHEPSAVRQWFIKTILPCLQTPLPVRLRPWRRSRVVLAHASSTRRRSTRRGRTSPSLRRTCAPRG